MVAAVEICERLKLNVEYTQYWRPITISKKHTDNNIIVNPNMFMINSVSMRMRSELPAISKLYKLPSISLTCG